jgi:hypothetical protein
MSYKELQRNHDSKPDFSKDRIQEEIDKEFIAAHQDSDSPIFTKGLQNKSKESKLAVYCPFDEHKLKYVREKELDLNKGIYKQVWKSSLCDNTYWGFSKKDLILVTNPKVKVIIEEFE